MPAIVGLKVKVAAPLTSVITEFADTELPLLEATLSTAPDIGLPPESTAVTEYNRLVVPDNADPGPAIVSLVPTTGTIKDLDRVPTVARTVIERLDGSAPGAKDTDVIEPLALVMGVGFAPVSVPEEAEITTSCAGTAVFNPSLTVTTNETVDPGAELSDPADDKISMLAALVPPVPPVLPSTVTATGRVFPVASTN